MTAPEEQPSEDRAKALTLTQLILGLSGLQLGHAKVEHNRSTGRLLFLKPYLLSSSFYIFCKSQCPSTASLALSPTEEWKCSTSPDRDAHKLCTFSLPFVLQQFAPRTSVTICNTVFLFTTLMELAPQFLILLNLSEEHRLLYFQSVQCPQPPSK